MAAGETTVEQFNSTDSNNLWQSVDDVLNGQNKSKWNEMENDEFSSHLGGRRMIYFTFRDISCTFDILLFRKTR